MPRMIDLTNERFGDWTVVEKGQTINRKLHWICRCDCGIVKEVRGENLRSGKSTSCGECKRVEYKPDDVHYGRAVAIIQRCYDKNHKRYKDYGGRGITCFTQSIQELVKALHELDGFEDGLTIDRINNDGNYEIDNMRWADYKTQNNNRRQQKNNKI